MAVLEKNPAASLHSLFNHAICLRSLALAKWDRVAALAHVLFLCKLEEVGHRIWARRKYEDKWDYWSRIFVALFQIEGGRNGELWAELCIDIVLDGGNKLVGAQGFEEDELLKLCERRVPWFW